MNHHEKYQTSDQVENQHCHSCIQNNDDEADDENGQAKHGLYWLQTRYENRYVQWSPISQAYTYEKRYVSDAREWIDE